MPSAVNRPLESHLDQFGLCAFRPGQREVITAVLAGKDCLCIMPTGGGKSLCYQLPSIAREGVTLVISPLIALMKDQVDVLQQKGIRADYINSTLDSQQQAARLQRLANREYDLLYVAPERFRSQLFLESARTAGVQLFAVDEAHCISEWGHDFRHDYARLGRYRRRLGSPQTIALTATATPSVRRDVAQQLELRSPETFVAGFARPNLRFRVATCRNRSQKNEELLGFLQATAGLGIIYVSTRKACLDVAETITQTLRKRVGVYHAGLPNEDRRRTQDRFMSDELDMVIATNAFGMGIDKANVRFVVHYNMPGSVESYYQEAGRAGRDGEPADCLLLYSHQDRYIQEFFIESAYPDPEVVCEVYEFLRTHPSDPVEITQLELKDTLELDISAEGVGTCERLLEKCGALQRLEPHRNMAIVRIDSDLPSLVDLLPKQAEIRRKVLRRAEKEVGDFRYEPVYFQPSVWARDTELPLPTVTRALRELDKLDSFEYVPPFRGRAIHVLDRDREFDELVIDFEYLQQRKDADYRRLERMLGLANTSRCRQLEMLNYFGDPSAAVCGCCDNCDSRLGTGKPGIATTVASEPAVLEAARMALSGVARARQRFGKQLIAAMLGGSQSSKVSRWRLDELSTFGLLRHLTQVEIGDLLDAMISAGLLSQNEIDRFRPILKLTPLGEQVMRGQSNLDGQLSLSTAVLDKLRHFHRIASGTARNDTPVTRNHTSQPRHAGQPQDEDASPTNVQQIQPSFYWTWRLANAGFSLDECAAIRRLDVAEIVDHLLLALEHGHEISLERLFTDTQRQQLSSIALDNTPSEVTSTLPTGLTTHHVQLYEQVSPSADDEIIEY